MVYIIDIVDIMNMVDIHNIINIMGVSDLYNSCISKYEYQNMDIK